MDKREPGKPDAGKTDDVQGEGDYRSARKFDKDERDFVKDEAKVKAKAREAADALDGPEGEELEKARAKTAKGETK
jgi:hypothetical protein